MNEPELPVDSPAPPPDVAPPAPVSSPADDLKAAISGQPPAPPAPVAEPAATPPAPPVETFKIKWNGQERELTRDELIAEAQKGYDYTQKTSQLSQRTKLVEQVATILARERQQIAQAAQDRQWLEQRLAALPAVAPPAPEVAPDEVPTIEQVQKLTEAKVAEARNQILGEVEQARYNAEMAKMEADYTATINATIKTLAVEKFPILNEMMDEGDVEILLRSAAAKFVNDAIQANPYEAVSLDKVKEAMVKAAEGKAGKFRAKIDTHTKMAEVRKAKLSQEGIEPPGGQTPPPPAPTKHKLGDPALTQSVIAELTEAFTRAGR